MPESQAEPLGQEREGAGMPGARAEGCFPSRAGVPLSAGCARLGWVRGWGLSWGPWEEGDGTETDPCMCVCVCLLRD